MGDHRSLHGRYRGVYGNNRELFYGAGGVIKDIRAGELECYKEFCDGCN